MIPLVVDLDDFCDEYAPLDLLEKIKAKIPQFRITLFTIPARTTKALMETMLDLDWVDLVPHGWMHETNHECAHWGHVQITECLKRCEERGFHTKGFKAPGWQISEGCYYGLRDRGYWVADQKYNSQRWIEGLRLFVRDGRSIHGHAGGSSVNALPLLVPKILSHPQDQFLFAREVINEALQIPAHGSG